MSAPTARIGFRRMAARLREGLAAAGAQFASDSPTNQLFVARPADSGRPRTGARSATCCSGGAMPNAPAPMPRLSAAA
ncbi:hypothetical protein FZ025_11565 [Xanthomonas hyacinthi]|uniref:hypothetical protein n=1 Tax=Xanthomonas hyacinthi TaxID=56455 RepID=UPI0011B01779|nr:hypothetical protein [Xanthomonas hyacinthi]QGY77244.1 hypothetical protein FZ025_11565 [Xanthomonas hyacinthi]